MQDFLVSGLRRLVEKTASEFDPALLSAVTATAAVDEWARIERVACAAKLRAAGRAEETGIDAEGVVADSSGITSGAARKQTRLNRKLRNKPKTAEAFAKGDVSATEADAIADAVDADPSTEEDLLGLAESASTTDVIAECNRIRRDAMDADGGLAAKQRAERRVREWVDALGMTQFRGAIEPLIGAKFSAELRRRADRMFREQVRAGQGVDTLEQRMADALAEIIEGCAPNATRGKQRGPRTVVHLLVTKDAAERGHVGPGDKCETAEGQPIPMRAVDDALLDPDTKTNDVEVDAVDVRSIRTNTRYVPARLQDALIARGRCCSVRGCGRTKGLQRDHNHEYAKGGATSLANMGWLCAYHHDLKTRGLYSLWRDESGGWHWEPTNRARAPA